MKFEMQSLTKTVIFSVIYIVLLGCDKPDPEVRYVDKVAPTATKTCASEDDYSLANESVVQFKEVTLVRKHQMVQRLDCQGKILSKKIEEVSAPKKTVTITSTRKFTELNHKERQRRLRRISSSAYNRQTCSTVKRDLVEVILFSPAEAIVSMIQQSIGRTPFSPSMKATLDYSPAVFTTEVDAGVQMVDYEFTSLCPGEPKRLKEARRNGVQIPLDQICQKSFEKGTVVFAIKYKEKTLPGTKIVMPVSCQ